MRNSQLLPYVIVAQGRAKPPGFWFGLGLGIGVGMCIAAWMHLLWG